MRRWTCRTDYFRTSATFARASGVAATVQAARIPLSAQAAAAGPDWLETAWIGGDDYELLLAAPHGVRPPPGVSATRIGRLNDGEGVRVLGADGQTLAIDQRGWSHFA